MCEARCQRKNEAWQKLSSKEIEQIEQSIDYLKASVKGNEHRLIRDGIERLDRATRRLAEVMMDDTLAGAITGKTMESAGEDIGKGPAAPHPFAKADIDESHRDDSDKR